MSKRFPALDGTPSNSIEGGSVHTRFALLLALAFPLTSTPVIAQSHAKTSAPNPVGTYDLDLEMHGQVTGAVLTITREKDGKLLGTLEVHGQAISFTDIKQEGKELQLSTGSELTFALTYKDDSNVTGTWTRPDGSGGIQGVRRKG